METSNQSAVIRPRSRSDASYSPPTLPSGGDFTFDNPTVSAHRLTMTGKHQLPDVFAQHPQVMSGALVFKGTRVPVQTFFDHLDHGGTLVEFLDWYDGVTKQQLEAAEEIRIAAPA